MRTTARRKMPRRSKMSKAWLLLDASGTREYTPKTMGERIRHWRLINGWTQTDLATVASKYGKSSEPLSKSFIALLESGKSQPSIQNMRGIALALGCSLDYLASGAKPRQITPPLKVKVSQKPGKWTRVHKGMVVHSPARTIIKVVRGRKVVRSRTLLGTFGRSNGRKVGVLR